jgi:hypothetical protein
MAHRSLPEIPPELRTHLESARLNLLALFRALDQMNLSARQIPQDLLHQLFELDADFAEALWALDQPSDSLDFNAMLCDTNASLMVLSDVCDRFRDRLPPPAASTLSNLERSLLPNIDPEEAYNQVPGRDPKICWTQSACGG